MSGRVLLDCNHTQEFRYAAPPVIGDSVYCRRCMNYQLVIPKGDDYHTRCTACRHSRAHGADRAEAYRSAVRHINKNGSGHPVRITRNGVLERELTEETPPLNSLVEWLANHPDHHQALKRLKPTNSVTPDISRQAV